VILSRPGENKKVLQSVTGDSAPTAGGTAPGLVMTVLQQSRRMLDEPHAGLSPAKTNPMIGAIGAMMAAQISDTVGQDLEAGRLDFRLASAPGAEAHGGLLDGAKHRRKLAVLTTIDSRAIMDR